MFVVVAYSVPVLAVILSGGYSVEGWEHNRRLVGR